MMSAQTDEKPKKNWKKKLLKISLGSFAFFALAILFLPLYSSLFTGIITGQVEKIIGRKASIESLSLNLITSKLSIGNISIKESDGTKSFVDLQNVLVDFSIFPLLSGGVQVPICEVSGLKVHVEVDEAGKANYQSILEHLAKSAPAQETSEKPENLSPSSEESAPLELPEVKARLLLSDISFYFNDKKQKQSFELKNFSFDCLVDGLDKISYTSTWQGANFKSAQFTSIEAGTLYDLSGTASLVMENGQPGVNSEGKLSFSKMYAKGITKNDYQDKAISMEHKLHLDLNKGICRFQDITFNSDYLSFSLSKLAITRLDQLQKLAQKLPQTKKPEELKKLLKNLSLQGWEGKFNLSFDLNRLNQDFGDKISQESKGQVDEFGGTLTVKGTLDGSETGLSIKEDLSLKGFYVKGKMPQKSEDGKKLDPKAYEIRLEEVSENIVAVLDIHKMNLALNFNSLVTLPGKEKPVILSKVVSELKANNILSPDAKINKGSKDVSVNFSALNVLLRDFIPADTKIQGRLKNVDGLSGSLSEGFQLKGKTLLQLKVDSPETKGLPPLQVSGVRDIFITLGENYSPEKIDFRKVTLNSYKNEILRFLVAGSANLSTNEFSNVKLAIASKLQDLEPYMSPFVPGIKLGGDLQHVTLINSKNKEAYVSGGGRLNNFSITMEQDSPEDSLKLALEPIRWYNEAKIVLEDDEPKITLTKLGGTHPAMSTFIRGSVHPQRKKLNLSCETKVQGKPLQNALPLKMMAEKDPSLKTILEKNLSLGGSLSLLVHLDGVLSEKLELKTKVDLTPFEIQWKNSPGEPLLNKTQGYPLRYENKISLTLQENPTIAIHPMMFEVAAVKGYSGGLYIDEEMNLTSLDKQNKVNFIGIDSFSLDHLHPILPILKKIGMNGAELKMHLYDLGNNLKNKDVQGKLRFHLNIPHISLVKLEEDFGSSSATEEETSPKKSEEEKTKVEEKKEEDQKALVGLESQVRDMLKKFMLDCEIKIATLELDKTNQMRDFQNLVYFNKNEPNNQFVVKTTGKLNNGHLNFELLGDLSLEHPTFETSYDIVELPYMVNLFSPLTKTFEEFFPSPLFAKMNFSDTSKTTFGMQGGTFSRGMDPRAVKKSLKTTRNIQIKLPSGEFDLGFSLNKFIDEGVINKDINEQIAPLRESLAQLQDSKKLIGDQLATVQKQLDNVQAIIKELESKASGVLDLIDSLKPLAMFNKSIRKKIEKAEAESKKYLGQTEKYEKENSSLLAGQSKLQKEMDKLNAQIKKTEKEISEAEGDLQNKINFANPFDFKFDFLVLDIAIDNDNPWKGSSDLSKLTQSKTSDVIIEAKFSGEKKDSFPSIKGTHSLDGDYSFQCKPAQKIIDKNPILGQVIPTDGITWTQDGFFTEK